MTRFQRFWTRLSERPLLSLLALVAVQTQFALGSRALWFSDEVRYANAYENMEHMGAWVVLALNGQPYPDKPPLYFWFLSLLDKLTMLDPPEVFFLGSALSGLGFLWAVWFLGRSTGMNRSLSLAGAFITSTSIFFAAILHYSRMDLMFATLIVAAMGCLARYFVLSGPGRWAVLGLGLSGLAVLVKGPLGALFPLLSMGIFCAWQGQWKKLLSRPVLLGILACLGVAACWVVAALAVEGPAFVKNVFVEQIFKRATNTFHHKEGPFYYFLVLPAVWLPWPFFIAGLPLARLGEREFWAGLWRSRTGDGAVAWLWVFLLSSFGLLSMLSGKVVIYLLPLFAPLSLLTARALSGMDEKHRTRSWTALAGFLALLGLALPFADLATQWPQPMDGLLLLALILLALAFAIHRLRATFRPALTTLVLGITVWIIPATLITAPSLDPVMSPKAQAERIGQYMREGYVAVAYDIYSGIYTYYAGGDLIEIPKHTRELDAICASHPKVIIAMKKKHLERWPERPEGIRVVHEQWITDQPYILLEWNSPDR